ncbi:MAG: exodeoxyribonuclease VII small subunit [Oscillospiraceae bacterium]
MKKKLSFEESVLQLEEIITKMDSGDITLDESLQKYKDAIELIANCNKLLENAKLKVETITMNTNVSEGEEE